jgi:hypothetical protein
LVLLSVIGGASCSGPSPSFEQDAPVPRRSVIWLDKQEGLDAETAARLLQVGVDQVVVWRGVIDLAGAAPVLRLHRGVPVEGPIPFAIALEVEGVRENLGGEEADAVWRGLEAELGGSVPAELILDLPRLADGLDVFVTSLTERSGVLVVPLLSFNQLQEPLGQKVAAAARLCVVPAFGTDGADLRGVRDMDPLPLANKLEAARALGIRVRPAIVLRPRTEPVLATMTEDLDRLTENDATTVSTASSLDRTFTFNRSMEWNGNQWGPGDELAIRWHDAARLDAALTEIHRLQVPEAAGWDLVPLPSQDLGLGLPRDTLLRYLEGDGPRPELDVTIDRNGRWVRVQLANRSPFPSAVSRFGNWIQVVAAEGWVSARDSGGFERMALGTQRGGRWKEGDLERFDAVRFYEVYVASGEEVLSGRIQLPSSRSRIEVSWSVTLSDGSKVAGQSP